MDVAIIKYNAGNIYSVDYALKRLGVTPIITADPALLRKADKVIFPGVGEAFTTMEYLRAHQLDQVIKSLKQPVLGICLGMQMLFEKSFELCNRNSRYKNAVNGLLRNSRFVQQKRNVPSSVERL